MYSRFNPAVICFFTLAAFSLFGAEFIKNGSFENYSADGVFDHWDVAYKEYQVSQEQIHTGQTSLKLSGTTKKGLGVIQIIKGFKPEAQLKLTSHIYIEEFTAGIVKPIHIAFKSGGKTHYLHTNLLFNKNPNQYELGKWLTFEKELDLSNYPDVTQIYVYCLAWALGETPFEGTVYFDDITVSGKGGTK